MKATLRRFTTEDGIYIVIWLILFLSPVMGMLLHQPYDADSSFHWDLVLVAWKDLSIFFMLFLIHNYFLTPLLLSRTRKVLYFVVASIIVALFTIYQCSTRPEGPRGDWPPEMREQIPPDKHGQMDDDMPGRPYHKPHSFKPDNRPPLIFGEHDIIAVIVLIMLFGMNIGIKLYFRTQHILEQQQKEHNEAIRQQLEYLKYQINPHFFMNTLNNIHSLIDIDSEQAKETVLQLGKLMRYLLYDSERQTVPLSKEVEFLDNYFDLMKIRYTDRLKIVRQRPDDINGIDIPPLLFISFIENAFKHGVSNTQDSFIEAILNIQTDEKGKQKHLHWTCRNSKVHIESDNHNPATKPLPRQGGVGLTNIRRRLDLIYGKNYTLQTLDNDKDFLVVLDITLTDKKA